MSRGVLYIGFGDNFVKEMLFSAESVKVNCPTMHITVFSDREVDSEFVDECRLIEVKHIRAKVDYIQFAPYDETIFLDTDTIVDHDISEMFGILEKYDFAMCHDLARKRENVSKLIPEYDDIPYAFSEVNPGVMVFSKNERVDSFFSNWRELFYKYFNVWPYEQPTFRVALWQSDMSLYILPIEYNVRGKNVREKAVNMHDEFGEGHLKARVYHMHADSKINQGQYDIQSVDEALEYCKKNYLEY